MATASVVNQQLPAPGTGRRKAPAPITVTLPDLPSVPAGYRGQQRRVSKLLGAGHTNAKLAKSDRASLGYRTYGLSLAPANTSGHQLCPGSSPGCRESCLFYQGRGVVHDTWAARVAKALAFFEHRDWFAERLRWEVGAAVETAKRAGLKAAFRLNVLSDVPWEAVFPWLFAEFPDAQFYDYSKVARRAIKFARGGGPANYDLTFSRSECNDPDCLDVLQAGGNVAVVFRSAPLPSTWCGHPVVNGDLTDLRFLDPPGAVIGLTAKGKAKRDRSGFVVDSRGGRQPLPLVS